MSERCIIDCAISLAALWIIWRGAKSLWRDLTEPPPPYFSPLWTEQADEADVIGVELRDDAGGEEE